MSPVIVPKSDQINADDLIAGPMTITIREVQIRGGQEQPVSIFFDGSDKAYRPCKSMSRVLVQGWGADAKAYVGRSLTLYRDPTVKWAGMEVGGIRISHMSHIDGAKMMMLTASKGSRKPHKVMPLVIQQPAQQEDAAAKWANGFKAKLLTLADAAAVQAFEAEKANKLGELLTARPELYQDVHAALKARKAQLSTPATSSSFDDDDFSSDTTPAAETKPAEPATLLDAVDQGGASEPGEDPPAAKANEIIGQVTAAISTMDVDTIKAREQAHIDAMPKELADHVLSVIEVRKSEIKEAHEKAKAAEQEPAE